MKIRNTFALLTIAIGTMIGHAVSAAPVYMRSEIGRPWDDGFSIVSFGDELTMNDVFGNGNWDQEYYESSVLSSLLPTTSFIFMEMGDDNWQEGIGFIAANEALLTSWISDGGRLLIVGAPNEGSDGDNMGFGSTWDGSVYSGLSVAAGPHAIFSGPATPVSGDIFGSSTSHGAVSNDTLTAILLDASDPTKVLLGEKTIGNGLLVMSTITFPWFHDTWTPQPEARNLGCNIVAYTAGVNSLAQECGTAEVGDGVPAPGALALVGLGLFGLGAFRRRRA